jgi:single-stranded DNA-binding protein
VWRQTAENLARYKGKGDTIAVTGRLRTRISELQARDLEGNPLTYSDNSPILTSVKFVDIEVENVTYINQARNAGGAQAAPPKPQAPQRPAKPFRRPATPQQERAGTQGGRTDDFAGDLFGDPADPGIPVDAFEQMMADISDEALAAA